MFINYTILINQNQYPIARFIKKEYNQMQKIIKSGIRDGKEIEELIASIIDELTLEEKVGLCHGVTKFTSGGVERLGIEGLSLSDGPHGVREEFEPHEWRSLGRESDKCTYLPTGSALAATWNPEMARLHGSVLGSEARARGKDVILGPAINIVRHPLCGRNFEYMSEDPYLVSKMAPAEIEGIQKEDVAACAKHFIMNNQEEGRSHVDINVDDKTLRDIYLKGFHSCTDAYTFMGAYNKFRSQHCCHNNFLVNGVLKGEWKYDGVFVSDWFGAHDTEESVYCGLDLEMGTEHPYNEYFLADPFLKMARESEEVRKILDDKVSRILRLMFRIGKFDPERKKGEFNTKAHRDAAYTIAAEAMTLLKNDHGTLPLKAPESILVVGENAVREHAHGGGSSSVMPYYEVTLFDGIKRAFPDAEIEYVTAAGLDFRPIPVDYLSIADTATGCRAFRCETFENSDYSGKKTVEFRDEISNVEAQGNARVFVGELSFPKTGDYYFEVTGIAGVQVYFGDDKVCELAGNKERDVVHKHYEAGESVLIIIKVQNSVKTTFRWSLNDDIASSIEELCAKAKDADAVIYCGGLNHNFDSECFDRKDMKLPEVQNKELSALLDACPDTVVALTAGSPVEMPWIDKAHCVLWTWYAGLEAGKVFGDIISGKLSPSGKLPITMPVRLEDAPCSRYGEYRADRCEYKEGSLVGYRGYDADGIKPLFAFGHGLSYTDFDYSDLALSTDNGSLTVSLTLRNVGNRDGKEVVQIYVGKENAKKGSAPKELKGFEKVFLRAGEEKRITVIIGRNELTVYDTVSASDIYLSGTYRVFAASSALDIRLEGTVEL